MTGLRSRHCVLLLLASSMVSLLLAAGESPQTLRTTIDDDGPRNPWGSTVGDINGDGRPDLVVGGHARRLPGLLDRVVNKLGIGVKAAAAGELVWYQNPNWQKHLITTEFNNRTDLAVGDVDGDGVNDIVLIADQGVFWLKNPSWHAEEIPTSKAPSKFHDVELSDLDHDGDIDIVVGEHDLERPEGARLLLYSNLDGKAGDWRKTIIATGDEHHNGALPIDLDQDGDKDIVSIGWGHSNVLVYENLSIR